MESRENKLYHDFQEGRHWEETLRKLPLPVLVTQDQCTYVCVYIYRFNFQGRHFSHAANLLYFESRKKEKGEGC